MPLQPTELGSQLVTIGLEAAFKIHTSKVNMLPKFENLLDYGSFLLSFYDIDVIDSRLWLLEERQRVIEVLMDLVEFGL